MYFSVNDKAPASKVRMLLSLVMNIPGSPRLPSFLLLSQLAFWSVLFAFIVTVSFSLLDWPASMIRAFLILSCHILNFYAVYRYLVPRYFERGRHVEAVIGFLCLLTVLTPIRIAIEFYFQEKNVASALSIGKAGWTILMIVSELTIAAFAAMLRLAASREEMRAKVNELERSHLETELRFLKGQMSPHFLFNSINNIYSLVLVKADEAPDALMKLSGLLRYLLYDCDQKVPIGKEIEALKAYADLFQLKFREPLNLRWSLDVSDRSRYIEPLVLVPLLENTVKHGGLGRDPAAEASFEIYTDASWVVVKTFNTISSKAGPVERGGIGLANIKHRLGKTFSRNYKLKVSKTSDQFVLYLKMPLL